MINLLPHIIWKSGKIFGRFTGMALPPFGIVLSLLAKNIAYVMNHEWTHWLQAKELLYIGFPIVYFGLWPFYGYYNHPMEREARENKGNGTYNFTRKKYSWTKFMDKPWWNKKDRS